MWNSWSTVRESSWIHYIRSTTLVSLFFDGVTFAQELIGFVVSLFVGSWIAIMCKIVDLSVLVGWTGTEWIAKSALRVMFLLCELTEHVNLSRATAESIVPTAVPRSRRKQQPHNNKAIASSVGGVESMSIPPPPTVIVLIVATPGSRACAKLEELIRRTSPGAQILIPNWTYYNKWLQLPCTRRSALIARGGGGWTHAVMAMCQSTAAMACDPLADTMDTYAGAMWAGAYLKEKARDAIWMDLDETVTTGLDTCRQAYGSLAPLIVAAYGPIGAVAYDYFANTALSADLDNSNNNNGGGGGEKPLLRVAGWVSVGVPFQFFSREYDATSGVPIFLRHAEHKGALEELQSGEGRGTGGDCHSRRRFSDFHGEGQSVFEESSMENDHHHHHRRRHHHADHSLDMDGDRADVCDGEDDDYDEDGTYLLSAPCIRALNIWSPSDPFSCNVDEVWSTSNLVRNVSLRYGKPGLRFTLLSHTTALWDPVVEHCIGQTINGIVMH
jgi:hypothetical protein